MTTYTAIPDANLEPGKPARSVDAILLRDNPIAITEGAAGAPKIQTAALEANLIDNYIASMPVGGVGTYIFAFNVADTSTDLVPGATVAGSTLRYAGVYYPDEGAPPSLSAPTDAKLVSGSAVSYPISGTWRCMSFVHRTASGAGTSSAGIFLRIS